MTAYPASMAIADDDLRIMLRAIIALAEQLEELTPDERALIARAKEMAR